MDIRKALFDARDEKYRDFQSALMPTIPKETVIGVRTPALRKIAKQILRDGSSETHLRAIPHEYFEEDQLHAFIISDLKDFNAAIDELDRFLPYVNNWATCDQTSPKVFKAHRDELMPHILRWLGSEHTYAIRFAILTLMRHFLEDDFTPEHLDLAASACCEEYYINMMVAWFFATALDKQYEATLEFIESKKLPKRTHNKAIQKAIESYRISPEQKAYLKALKIK